MNLGRNNLGHGVIYVNFLHCGEHFALYTNNDSDGIAGANINVIFQPNLNKKIKRENIYQVEIK